MENKVSILKPKTYIRKRWQLMTCPPSIGGPYISIILSSIADFGVKHGIDKNKIPFKKALLILNEKKCKWKNKKVQIVCK